MSIKSFAVASLLALSAIASTAQAAATWTITGQGVVSSGWDQNGIFGAANRNLAGLQYTQSITASVDSSQWSSAYTFNNTYIDTAGMGPAFTTTTTIDGVSRSFTSLSTAWGEQFVSNIGSGYGWPDEVYSYNEGVTAEGASIAVQQYAYSYDTNFSTLDYAQSFTTAINGSIYGGSYFYLGGNQNTYFNGQLNSIAVNGNVPEPASLALLGLGLAGVAAARRKQALRK